MGDDEWCVWLERQRGRTNRDEDLSMDGLRVEEEGGGLMTSVCFDGDALLFRNYVSLRGSAWSLKAESALKGFDVSGCRIWDGGAKVLSEDLVNSVCTLEDLDFSDNGIGDLGMRVLMPLLLRCTRLERLDLAGNCFMDVEGEIVGGLMQLPSLASLNLSRNQSFLGMWALELSTSITELILCGQQGGQALVDNENCVILSQHLRGNNTLETLDLDSNDIGDSGAAALASLLVPRERGGCCLTYLGLRNNLIGVPGAEALAKSLTQNSTLVDLDLRLNAIEGMGVYCVLTSLVSNQTIESLLLGENVRSFNSVTAHRKMYWEGIGKCISSCTSLVALDLSSCGVDNKGASDIAAFLSAARSPPLRVLHLNGNPFGHEGCLALASALDANRTLRVLSIPGGMQISGVIAIGSALRRTPRPKGFMLMSAGLGRVWEALGLPSEALAWADEDVLEWFDQQHQQSMLAFAMGLNPRLGAESLLFGLLSAEDCMGIISRFYWGPPMPQQILCLE